MTEKAIYVAFRQVESWLLKSYLHWPQRGNALQLLDQYDAKWPDTSLLEKKSKNKN